MENQSNRTITVAVVAAIVALLLGLCGGAVLGGMAGYALGRGSAARVEAPGNFPGPQQLPGPLQPKAPEGGQTGVFVQDVVDGSPAAQAGIQPGDTITQIDGVTIDAAHPLASLLAQHRPGDRVPITLISAGATRTVNVRLAANPSDPQRAYLGIRYSTSGGVAPGAAPTP